MNYLILQNLLRVNYLTSKNYGCINCASISKWGFLDNYIANDLLIIGTELDLRCVIVLYIISYGSTN